MTRSFKDRATLPRRAFLAAAPALILAGPAAAQDPVLEGAGRLRGGRMSTPVMIDDRGPFSFAVDSAANASVIAEDLARALGLAPAGQIGMHTLIAREVVDTVTARRVRSGTLDRQDVRLALAPRLGLDGADGLIGADLLADHQLVLSFRGSQTARIGRPRHLATDFLAPENPTTRFQAPAENRLGSLLAVNARSGNAHGLAIIDTGAEVSIVNTAFAVAAGASPIVLRDGSTSQRVGSPTGRSVEARPMMLRDFRFAGVILTRVPVLVGDFHTFDLWGLSDRPAALLGVDLLGLFERVVVDLKRGELVIDL